MNTNNKGVSASSIEHISQLSKKRQRMIWRAIAFYWHVHLYERHKISKKKPGAPAYELIQQSVLNVYGKEKAEPVLNTLLELGSDTHPFNTLIYEAANGVPPTEMEKMHSFCLGCITWFKEDYENAVRELVEEGIIKKTSDNEWMDYLKRCNSFLPEIVGK